MKDLDGGAVEPEKALGQKLQDARRTAGITQQVLCQRANLSYSTLAKIERGAIKSPSIFTIQSIAAALNTTLDALLGIPAATIDTVQAAKTTSRSGIKFVYFDINGCLLHFFHRAFANLARDTGASADIIESAFWLYNDDACSGKMTMDDFNVKLAKRIGVASVDWEAYYLDSVEPIPGMDELVRWTAERFRIGLLTNIMPGFVLALRARGLLPDVDYELIIDSSEVGAIKPQAKIYEIAAAQAALKPSEILLIDDDRPNVMAADKLGWRVLWCDDYQPAESINRVHQALA